MAFQGPSQAFQGPSQASQESMSSGRPWDHVQSLALNGTVGPFSLGVSDSDTSPRGHQVDVNGQILYLTDDYTITASQITFVSAPAATAKGRVFLNRTST